jgi:hypothetical protein
MKVYNTLVLPMLLYGSEIWTLSKKDTKQVPSIQIKIFRRRAGYTLFDHKRNEEILEQMKVEPVNVKLRIIQTKLATTCNKNEQQHDAKAVLSCRPNGRSRLGRPLKRLLDEAETGLSRPNS